MGEDKIEETLPGLINAVHETGSPVLWISTKIFNMGAIQAHSLSAMTMNFIRSLVDGGFADVHHTEYWNLSWVEHSPLADEFHKLTESLGQSLRFMETITGREIGRLRRVDFFTSHEALHLH